MNSQRENYGTAFAAIGGYSIMGDLLDVGNHWVIGLIWLVIGTVLFLWPEGTR